MQQSNFYNNFVFQLINNKSKIFYTFFNTFRISFETLQNDLNNLSQRIQRFENSLQNKCEDDFFNEFKNFIRVCNFYTL